MQLSNGTLVKKSAMIFLVIGLVSLFAFVNLAFSADALQLGPYPTSTKVSCSPNPVRVEHTTICTSVTSGLRHTPLTSYTRFFADGKRISGKVACTFSDRRLTCTVSYAPTQVKIVRIVAKFPKEVFYRSSSGMTALKVTA
jgi:hypothetical protein